MNNLTMRLLFIIFALPFIRIESQWIKTNYIPAGFCSEIATSGNTIFVGSSTDGIFKSTDNGSTWIQSNNGLPNTTLDPKVILCDGEFVIAGIYWLGIYVSTNGGVDWSAANNGLPSDLITESIVKVGNDLFAGTNQGVFYSNDNAASWSGLNAGLPDLTVTALTIKEGYIFAAVYEKGVFRSPIDPINWINVSTGLPLDKRINCFEIIGNKIFLGNWWGVYSSDDNGENWTQVNNGLGNNIVMCLAKYGNNLFASSGSGNGGVFATYDFGANWSPIIDGFTDDYPYVEPLALNETTIFAGGPGEHSVWMRPLVQITEVEELISESPVDFSLSQNYPNPFNPSTKIGFQIPEDLHVSLSVYDVLGKKVAVLINEFKHPGYYEALFTAKGLSSGIYFYVLKAGNIIVSKKMMIAK
ncbi:MAG: T9SS type A sorting domain-containing protein [bacterium]